MDYFWSHPYIVALVRILFAALLGGVIGLERSYHGRPAGMRTYAIVSLGSALLMLLTAHFVLVTSKEAIPGQFNLDPTRMAQGIMTGIGFLGAGVIVKENRSVRGLTTAASIWVAAALGSAVGVGLYVEATLGTILTLLILVLINRLELRLPVMQYGVLSVTIKDQKKFDEGVVSNVIDRFGFISRRISYQKVRNGRFYKYEATLRSRNQEDFRKLLRSLSKMEEIHDFNLSISGD